MEHLYLVEAIYEYFFNKFCKITLNYYFATPEISEQTEVRIDKILRRLETESGCSAIRAN